MRECKLHLDLPQSRGWDDEAPPLPETELTAARPPARSASSEHVGLHRLRKEGTRQVTITLPHSDWRRLRAAAAARNMPVSRLILGWIATRLRELRRASGG